MSRVSLKLRMTTLAALFAFCIAMMATSTGAMAAPSTQSKQTATAFMQGTSTAGDVLNGVFTVKNFTTQGNQLVAQGVLNGTLTSATGVVTPITNQAVTAPVSSATASCGILNLVLGPLSLNVLGLQINLNQVVLVITAIPGAGNLLGNLLCDVANLLNGTNLSGLSGLLNTLVTDLNSILAAL